MKLPANFWFRAFAIAFFIGSLATWPLFSAWLFFSAAQELRVLTDTSPYPVSMVTTSPLVDISIPGQEPIALNSFWSAVVISIFGGLLTAIFVLILTALYRLLPRKRCPKSLL